MKRHFSITKVKQKLFSPASYSIGATFALQGFSLLGFMLLARLLPVEEMGNWAIWLTLLAISDMTRQGLVRNGLVRFFANEPNKLSEWMSAGFLLSTIASVVLGIFLTLGAILLASISGQPGLWSLVYWAIPFFLLQGIGRFAETAQVARSDFKGIFWANAINGTIQLSLVAFLFLGHVVPELSQLLAFQAVGIFAGLVFTLFYRKSYFRLGFLKKEKCLELFHFGKYVAGTNFFSLLFQRLDTLLISIFLTPAAVAIYNVATRLNGLLDLPLNGLSQALYPRIVSEYAAKIPIQEVYGKNVRQLLFVQTPLTILLVISAPLMVQLLAGEAYLEAAPLVQLLALAGLVKPWGRTFGMTLDAVGKSDFNFKMLLLSFVINLSFSLSLLPLFGIIGAAVATGLGTITTTAIGQYFLKKQLAVRPWSI